MDHAHGFSVVDPYGIVTDIPHSADVGKYGILDVRFRLPDVSGKDLFLFSENL